MGVTGLETAFAALHTELVLPGRARPRPAGRAHDRRRRAVRAAGADARAAARRANVCLVDLDAEWEVGEAGYESRSANCAFAGRAADRPGADDGRRRARSPTASATFDRSGAVAVVAPAGA